MAILSFVVGQQYDGCKLETFLKKAQGVSMSTIRRARDGDGLHMDGQHIRTVDPVRADAVVTVRTEDACDRYIPCDIAVAAAYEDEDVVVFDKPAGMPCHPSKGHPYDTVANVFATHAHTKGLVFRCIGRLDSNTSGLVAIAKHPHASFLLAGQMPKRYLAVVCGRLPQGSFTLDAPIERMEFGNPMRCVREDGKNAVTHFETLLSGERYSLAALRLETGRTHQIRVHMRHFGCPLAGDALYGGSRQDIDRHALHCYAMGIPNREGIVTVISSLPVDMRALLATQFTENDILAALQKAYAVTL